MYEYRASELGGCAKMLVAKRLEMRPHDLPLGIVRVFERGHAHEEACLATMAAEGWQLHGRQQECTIPVNDDVVVSGHIDAAGQLPDLFPRLRLIEAKAPTAWRQFIDEVHSADPSPMIQRYKWQTSVYMVAHDMEMVLATLDANYTLRYHIIEKPFYSREQIIERVLWLEEMAREGLPKDCLPREYPCAYYHLHEDVIYLDSPVDLALEEAARDYKILSAQAAAAKETVDRLMGDRVNYRSGDLLITRSKARRRNVDYRRAFGEHGIDPQEYTTTTEYWTTRITVGREEEDGE